MALPPEPLEDLLPAAAVVVVAEVRSVDDLGPWPASRAAPDGAPPRPAQRVTLAVTRVLRGQASGEVTVEKPAGSYALGAGVSGAFLIDDHHVILGRYGPDTWSVDDVERALSTAAAR